MLASIGDLVLDVVVVPEGPLRPGDDVQSRVSAVGGGQAANFCAWVNHLGVPSRLITRIGDDAIGRLLVAELRDRGIDVRAVVGTEPTGAIVVLVGPDGERSFATQRGAIVHLRPENLDPTWFEDVALLHVPGYSLFLEPLASAALVAMEAVRSRSGMIAIDLSSTAGLIEYGADRMAALIGRIAPDILFAGESEAATLGGDLERLAMVAVRKRGAGGCSVRGTTVGGPRVDVVDTTGAGDAFAAAFCTHYLAYRDPLRAAREAVVVASRAVTKLGGRP